jgi:hypothetical protein
VTINYEAVTQLSQRLEKAANFAPFVVEFWLHKMVGPAMVSEMRAEAPVRSGRLRDAIRQINEPMKVRVGPIGVEYNQFVVEGTKAHEIKPKNASMLVFKIGGKTIYAKSVKHPGTAANPYMQISSAKVMNRLLPKLGQLQIDVLKTGKRPHG